MRVTFVKITLGARSSFCQTFAYGVGGGGTKSKPLCHSSDVFLYLRKVARFYQYLQNLATYSTISMEQ